MSELIIAGIIIAVAIIGVLWIASAQADPVREQPATDGWGDDEAYCSVVTDSQPEDSNKQRTERECWHDMAQLGKSERAQYWGRMDKMTRVDNSVYVEEE